jgi:hypothetical protein
MPWQVLVALQRPTSGELLVEVATDADATVDAKAILVRSTAPTVSRLAVLRSIIRTLGCSAGPLKMSSTKPRKPIRPRQTREALLRNASSTAA